MRNSCAYLIRRALFGSLRSLKFVPVVGCKFCRSFQKFLALLHQWSVRVNGGRGNKTDFSARCPMLKKHFQERSAELQIPPLRYASVGMTKGRVALSRKIGLWLKGTAGPSTTLRFGRDDTSVYRIAGLLGRIREGRGAHCGSLHCAPPEFPVEFGGVVALHAPFFTEGRTRCLVQYCVAGNPGTLRSG
jgi:hypothetical protein